MKLLHIGKFFPPYRGGMESYLFDLSREQVKQGHQVTVLVHNHQWGKLISPTELSEERGVSLIRLKSSRPVFHTPLMLGFNRQVNQIIADQKPDLIHLHWPNPSLLQLLFNRVAKQIPWVISWHSDMVTAHSSRLMKTLYRLIKPLESRLLKHTKAILVSSQNYANFSPQLIVHQDITRVVPLGLNTKELKAMKLDRKVAQKHWRKGGFRLFNLGRLTYYKNQQMLLESMQHMTDCQLLLAGGGQLESQLKNHIERTQLSDRVTLLGQVSWQKAHELFSSCDVFCLVSHDRAESFGVVLLEAMYHDKIILVADTKGSGMSWLANNYNKGFTFKANDVNDFIKQINVIKDNYEAITKRPKQFDYEIEKITEMVTTQYQSIIN